MRALVGMLPWVIVLAIAGTAVWLLLDRQVLLGTWVLGALIVGHGLVHGLYLVPAPDRPADGRGPTWPFDLGRSWLVALAGARRGRRLGVLLIAVILVVFALAGLSTVGILPAAWWPALVLAASVASLVLLLLAFDLQLILGVVVDAGLVALVLTGAWTPGSA
jgi:hypothetical protein